MTIRNFNYHMTHFVISAPDIRLLPRDEGIEVAFAGRSNAGKSSALNTFIAWQMTNIRSTDDEVSHVIVKISDSQNLSSP